jgi:hypothetical protein
LTRFAGKRFRSDAQSAAAAIEKIAPGAGRQRGIVPGGAAASAGVDPGLVVKRDLSGLSCMAIAIIGQSNVRPPREYGPSQESWLPAEARKAQYKKGRGNPGFFRRWLFEKRKIHGPGN